MHAETMSVGRLVDESMQFDAATIEAAKAFARSKPWRGELDERRGKFETAARALAKAIGMRRVPRVVFGVLDGSDSVSSSAGRGRIRLVGRLSVVTLLWTLARTSGMDDRESMRWAVNLFRAAFPKSFARCDLSGPFVRNHNRLSASVN